MDWVRCTRKRQVDTLAAGRRAPGGIRGKACPRTGWSPGPGAASAILDQKALSKVTLNLPLRAGCTAGQLAAVNSSTWSGGPT